MYERVLSHDEEVGLHVGVPHVDLDDEYICGVP